MRGWCCRSSCAAAAAFARSWSAARRSASSCARGQILRGGDLLLADDGRVIEVAAATETVSTVHSARCRVQLARAAYHLGNRHVALQIGDGWLRYRHDHVLDEMVQGLGLTVTVEQAPFEPEAGAYHADADGAHGHSHSDGHDHDHGH